MVELSNTLDLFHDASGPGRSSGGCGSCGSGMVAGATSKCGNGLEKIYPTTAVRFGYMRYIGEFTHPTEMKFTCGAKVVILTKRGIEIGDQVSLTCSGCDKSVTRTQMKEWVRRCGEDAFIFTAGRILREGTAGDLAEYARIQNDCRTKRVFAQSVADRHALPLTIADCEHLFGGERIIFFFTANERVDFRAMVKDLATEYRTRIEMRQIGARDEARLLADYETCGREVCCKVFLKTLRPVSMRMAKVQKATLDPTQVSGRCGRLKCCLRYEHESYEELDKKLPKVGVRIRTNHGEGVIVNRQILTQIVQIRLDDNELASVVAEDITAVDVPRPPQPEARHERTDGGAGRPRESGRRDAGRPQRRPIRDRGQSEQPQRGADRGETRAGETTPQETEGAIPEPGADAAPKTERSGEQPPRRGRRRRRRRRGGGGGSDSTPPPAAGS